MLVGVLALDDHVGLADGVGLGVQLLAEDLERGVGVQLARGTPRRPTACRRCRSRVVEGADDARLGERVVVLDEQQVDHQADDLAGGEVLAGGLVRVLGELADQLLEDVAHLDVATPSGWRSILRELAQHQVEQVRLRRAASICASNLNVSKMSRTLGEKPRCRRAGSRRCWPGRRGASRSRAATCCRTAARRLCSRTARGSARPSRAWPSASTASLVGSSTQSRRRSTVSGRITLPYSDCL